MIIKKRKFEELQRENAQLKTLLSLYITENTDFDEMFNTKFKLNDITQLGTIDGYRMAKFLHIIEKQVRHKYGNLSYLINKIIDCMPNFETKGEV